MAELASAYVSLLPSARGFGSKLESEVGSEVRGTGSRLGGTFGKLFAVAAGAFIGTQVVGFFKDSITEAREAQVVTARTENVIKSMGLQSVVSADQIGKLATSISNKTGIDDEAIQSGENLLLTFKNVASSAGETGGVFEQTTQLAVDMSAAMGTDMKSASIQLGKALNDPVRGLSALSRVGVSFSAQQQEQIKRFVEQGKVAKAQAVILGEVKNQFGGAGAAMATPADKARVAFANLKEQVGTALLPVLDRFLSVVSTKIVPAVAGFVAGMQSGTGAGGQFAAIATTVGSVLASTAGFIKRNSDVILPLVAGLLAGVVVFKAVMLVTRAWAAAQVLLNIVLAANPIGLVVIAIVALVAGVIYAYKHFDTFRAVVDATFSFLKTAVVTAIDFVKSHWKLILAILLGPVALAALAIASHWTQIKSIFSKGIAAVVGFLQALPSKAKAALSALGSAISGVFSAAFSKATEVVQAGITRVVDVVRSIPGKLRALGGLFADAGHAVISAFVNGLKGAGGLVSDIAGNVWDAVRGLLNNAIAKINAALSFTISLPGPDISINPPDIPMLAKGGPAQAGRPYIVGEVGPELFVPNQSGRVIPNSALRSGGAGLPADGAVLAELRAIRGALGLVGGDVGREINKAVRHGQRKAS